MHGYSESEPSAEQRIQSSAELLSLAQKAMAEYEPTSTDRVPLRPGFKAGIPSENYTFPLSDDPEATFVRKEYDKADRYVQTVVRIRDNLDGPKDMSNVFEVRFDAKNKASVWLWSGQMKEVVNEDEKYMRIHAAILTLEEALAYTKEQEVLRNITSATALHEAEEMRKSADMIEAAARKQARQQRTAKVLGWFGLGRKK
jgi:hypothetical protein